MSGREDMSAQRRARFILWMIPVLACGATGERSFHYEPEVVSLVGRLEFEEQYGPPNYGETPTIDAKVQVPILHLEAPIAVMPRPADSENLSRLDGIDRVQIQLDSDSPVVDEYANSCARVDGSLFEATTGHHRTPVVLRLIAIQRSDECRAPSAGAKQN